MLATDVVQRAVVGLTNHRVDGGDRVVVGLRQRPLHCPVKSGRHTERVRQDHRRFDIAQFHHLGRPGELPEAVGHVDRAGDLVLEQVAGMRQNGGHPGTHVVAVKQRHLANANPFDIGDAVVWPSWPLPRGYAQLAGTDTVPVVV